jgi:hypothetical protein
MDDADAAVNGSKPFRHRVTAKGKDIPKPIEGFNDLKEQYTIPPQVMSNLLQYGFSSPTGIQAHGIPVFLEVVTRLLSLYRHLECLRRIVTSLQYHRLAQEKHFLILYQYLPCWAHQHPLYSQKLALVLAFELL